MKTLNIKDFLKNNNVAEPVLNQTNESLTYKRNEIKEVLEDIANTCMVNVTSKSAKGDFKENPRIYIICGGPGLGKTNLFINILEHNNFIKDKDFYVYNVKNKPIKHISEIVLEHNRIYIFDYCFNFYDNRLVSFLKSGINKNGESLNELNSFIIFMTNDSVEDLKDGFENITWHAIETRSVVLEIK